MGRGSKGTGGERHGVEKSLRERMMPQSLESEQATLGSMLILPDAIDLVQPILQPKDFYREAHRSIYETILKLSRSSVEVDLITVAEGLKADGKLDKVGGAPYLMHLTTTVPAASNAEHYAEIVREKAELRKLIVVSDIVAGKCYDGSSKPDEIRNLVVDLVIEGRRVRQDEIEQVGDIVGGFFDEYAEPKTVVPLHIITMRHVMPGLLPGRYYVIGARPATGKSSLGIQMAEYAARNGFPSGFITLEMPKDQLAMRYVTALTRIPERELWASEHEEGFWTKMADAGSRLSELPSYLCSPNHGLDDVLLAMRTMVAKYKVKVLVIDYLQLIDPGPQFKSEYQQVTAVSRAINSAKVNLGIPIVAICQLSRAGENSSRAPKMSDLRGSGYIEQDADGIFFLHDLDSGEAPFKEIGLSVAKNRNGPNAVTTLRMDTREMTFVDLDLDPKCW